MYLLGPEVDRSANTFPAELIVSTSSKKKRLHVNYMIMMYTYYIYMYGEQIVHDSHTATVAQHVLLLDTRSTFTY
jgi:hypothetical protein